jgi:hypothetical protein
MKVKVYNKNIIYASFPTQKELTLTMCRPQEYYECDSSKLRGKVFTYEKLIDHYTQDDGHLSYFSVWSGFNIPSFVLEDFFSKFELTKREQKLYNVTRPYSNKPYYFIATKKNDTDTLRHELVHAHYYLNPVYKQAANILVKHMRNDLRKKLTAGLKEKGYASNVMIDEINAYMATSGTKYLIEEFELDVTKKDIKPFEDLARTVL